MIIMGKRNLKEKERKIEIEKEKLNEDQMDQERLVIALYYDLEWEHEFHVILKKAFIGGVLYPTKPKGITYAYLKGQTLHFC